MDWIELVFEKGFAIVVALYLLIRVEAVLKQLTEEMHRHTEISMQILESLRRLNGRKE